MVKHLRDSKKVYICFLKVTNGPRTWDIKVSPREVFLNNGTRKPLTFSTSKHGELYLDLKETTVIPNSNGRCFNLYGDASFERLADEYKVQVMIRYNSLTREGELYMDPEPFALLRAIRESSSQTSLL